MLDNYLTVYYFMKVLTYLKGVKSEFSRVHFPSRNEMLVGVGLVLFASFIAGLFFFLIDSVIYKIISYILNI